MASLAVVVRMVEMGRMDRGDACCGGGWVGVLSVGADGDGGSRTAAAVGGGVVEVGLVYL